MGSYAWEPLGESSYFDHLTVNDDSSPVLNLGASGAFMGAPTSGLQFSQTDLMFGESVVEAGDPALDAENEIEESRSPLSVEGVEDFDLTAAEASPDGSSNLEGTEDDAEFGEEGSHESDGAPGKRSRVLFYPAPDFLPQQRRYTVPELQHMLDSDQNGFTGAQRAAIRRYISVVRNRATAASSRRRRLAQRQNLETEIRTMTSESTALTSEINALTVENRVLNEQLQRMRAIVKNSALRRLADYEPAEDLESQEKQKEHDKAMEKKALQMITMSLANFLISNPQLVANLQSASSRASSSSISVTRPSSAE